MTTQTILWIVLAAILAFGIALFQYYFKKSKPKKWPWFVSLRFLTWFGLFLLLINPKFTQKKLYVEKPKLVVAVDNSASIDYLGESEAVKKMFASLKKNRELAESFELDFYSFGSELNPLDSLDFSENQTKIGAAFQKLQQIYKGKTAPVVLITDGNQTFGQSFVYQARQADLPIFPVVVGDTAQYLDLSIAQLNVNRYVFLDNKFPVEVFVNYNGTQPIETQVLIKQGETSVFRKKLEFSAKNNSEKVVATLPANRVGINTYSVIVRPLAKEKNKTNNHQNFAIEVIDQKTEVLILAGILHPDIGALKKAIESNRQRSVTVKKSGEGVDFGKYQLLVLYQPNQSFKSVYESIKKLKINTLTITGTATDYGFLNKMQSVVKKNPTSQTENYLPVYNENYNVFQFENIGFDDFPPLKDVFGSIVFKTGIQPLLFQNINGLQTETPLLATFETETGRRGAFLFGEGIWKWRAKNFLDTRSFEGFDGFIGKLVQYLASTKKRSRLELTYESFYKQGEAVIIEARYFDKNYVFDPGTSLTLTAKEKTSGKTTRRPFLLKNKRYTVNLSDFSPGEYQFTVRVENQNLSKSGELTLIDFEVEKQFMNANLEKLKQVATNEKERIYFLQNRAQLFRDLTASKAFKPVQKNRETTMPLIDWCYLLGIIVLSLSIEWFLRKYQGLI